MNKNCKKCNVPLTEETFSKQDINRNRKICKSCYNQYRLERKKNMEDFFRKKPAVSDSSRFFARFWDRLLDIF